VNGDQRIDLNDTLDILCISAARPMTRSTISDRMVPGTPAWQTVEDPAATST
jgi:hypothetical protein